MSNPFSPLSPMPRFYRRRLDPKKYKECKLAEYWKKRWDANPEALAEHLQMLNEARKAKSEQRVVEVKAVLALIDPNPMMRSRMELAIMDTWCAVYGERIDRAKAVATIRFGIRKGLIGKTDSGFHFTQIIGWICLGAVFGVLWLYVQLWQPGRHW